MYYTGKGIIYKKADYFFIEFNFNRDIISYIKESFYPKAKFNPKSGDNNPYWSVKANEFNLNALSELCKRFDLEHPDIKFNIEVDKVKILAKKKSDERKRILKLANTDKSTYKCSLPNVTLKPWQLVGCEYGTEVLKKNKAWFLGDDMGLGKTLQTISVVEDLKIYPLLVISTASLKYNWKDEYEKFNPKRSVSVGVDPTCDINILNYDIADKWLDDLVQYQYKGLVCDESHYLKNSRSKRSQAIKKIAKKVPYKILISGTPIKNQVSDIVNQLNVLGILDKEFGGWMEFVKRYCKAYKEKWGSWNVSGADNLEELQKKLKSTCFISRKKIDVYKDLDPKSYQHYTVDLSNKKEYSSAKQDLISWIKNGEVSSKYVQEALNLGVEDVDEYLEEKYKQLERVKELIAITYLRKLAGHGKIEAAIDWIENFLETTDEKLVVYAYHKEVQDSIINHFLKKKNTAFITSEKSAIVRSQMVKKFQEEDKVRLIICSMGAAAEGITLTAASQMLMVEYGWTPAIHKQVEDRIHRIGQKNKVWIHYLNAKDSIDSWMRELLVGKQSIVTEALGDDTFFIKDNLSKTIMRKIIKE